MIKYTKDGIEQSDNIEVLSFHYIQKKWGIGRIILPVTRYLRARNVEKYMNVSERHLDIGCGDGYFLKRSKSKERYGIDKLMGDKIIDCLEFPDSFFDYVTMLAVIEHLQYPEKIFQEVARILKPKGKFIFTTPLKRAEFFIRMYVKNIDKEHQSYFDYNRVKYLSSDIFDIKHYHTFIFGLNQVFCLQKN